MKSAIWQQLRGAVAFLEFIPFTPCAKPPAWFGVGPVWNGGYDTRVIGVSICCGNRGVAIVRRQA